jgi:ABC-type uncharacterized transport system ATPase subunit
LELEGDVGDERQLCTNMSLKEVMQQLAELKELKKTNKQMELVLHEAVLEAACAKSRAEKTQ